jgi:heme oxygenase
MTSHPPAPPPDLPQRLRLATRDLHAQAERTGVMTELLAGRLSKARYGRMLRNLHALYAALETGLRDRAGDPAVACVDHPAHHRAQALAADLAALHGPDWADLPLAETMVAYVARLRHLAAAGSPALLAHVYTRSLGDLHGGQILKGRVARMLALPDGAGTSFYDFGTDDEVQQLRLRLRTGLARLPVTAAEADDIVAEACWSFQQHQRLFSELAD